MERRVKNFVPSEHNPADIASRGCIVNELKNSSWFNGPSFCNNIKRNGQNGMQISTMNFLKTTTKN